MAAAADQAVPAGDPTRHTRRALSAGLTQLQRRALKAVGYALLAYLVLRLLPAFKQALHSLEHVSWEWIVGAIALEVLSEYGYVQSWRGVVDKDSLLAADGRGTRTATHAAWAQLGGGMVLPGGSLASIGVGAWILRHFGMPAKTIAERQFNLSFLNTGVDALALVVCGVGLAIGIFGREQNPLLTWLPACVASAGIGGALLLGRQGAKRARGLEADHPKLAASIGSLATAVEATNRILFHHGSRRSALGALAYLGFDALVLWTAFLAIGAHPVPGFAAVVMAYIIGALGGSIPLPAGIGAVGGIAGMLILYGVGRNAAIAAVLVYEAVGLLVPVLGAPSLMSCCGGSSAR
jgi:Lysylphosphatidylglycerol synthase TM region